FRLLGEGSLLEEAERAGAIVEGGVGQAAGGADRVGYALIAVAVARVGQRRFFEKFFGEGVGVLAVDAEEGDALAVFGGELLQGGELVATGPAPGGPDVDHDGISLQPRDAPFEGIVAAGEELAPLLIESGERCRRSGERLGVV